MRICILSVNKNQSEKIQKKLFEAGFSWPNSNQREIVLKGKNYFVFDPDTKYMLNMPVDPLKGPFIKGASSILTYQKDMREQNVEIKDFQNFMNFDLA